MRALTCLAYDGPESLAVMDVEKPSPGEGEVLIRVLAAGISYVDAMMSRNKHQNKHDIPFSPGMEIAGIVTELGNNVEGIKIGDKVAALLYDGGYAEYAVAKRPEIFVLPENCDILQTAAVFSVAMTAQVALVEKGQIKAGETVLIGGAAGGVGVCAIQLAKYHGAQVIAAVSSEERSRACLDAGADVALVYGPELRDQMRAANDGKDADIILDPVGGIFAEQAANCLNWDGRYLVIGFAGGSVPSFAANRLLVKNRSVHGVILGYYRWQKPEKLAEGAKVVLDAIASGALSVPIVPVGDLEFVPNALQQIENRQMIGKAVVKIAD